MKTFVQTAAAKINLSLEVLGRRADGYHELISLVAFAADIHDTVSLEPGDDIAVDVTGRFGTEIVGDNLVIKAALLALEARPGIKLGRFSIDKGIPVAAGVGGGSADAAAALRAIADANSLADPVNVFGDVAPKIGADVTVCLGGNGAEAALMSGIGERIARPVGQRLLDGFDVNAVLVNPRVQVLTRDVFTVLDAPICDTWPDPPKLPSFVDFSELLDYLEVTRNDLQQPALEYAPVIGDVLAVLKAQDTCRLARMSGSGATCFGLFSSRPDAERAANAIRQLQPQWWVECSNLS